MDTNTNNLNAPPEQDPQLAHLHATLKRQMPLATPPGLVTDIFRATVADLPERAVIAHLGWQSWTGWKYAAAIGLVFFYVAVWAKPNVTHSPISEQMVALNVSVFEEPMHELDEGIDEVRAVVADYARSFDPSWDLAWVEHTEDGSLAHQLLEYEQMFESDLF